MKKGEFIIALILISGVFNISFILASLEVGSSGEIGIDLIPDVPTNFSTQNVNNSQFLQGFTPTTLGELFNGSLNSIAWSRLGTDVFLTNSGDSVGIGTSSPTAQLEIVNNQADDELNQLIIRGLATQNADEFRVEHESGNPALSLRTSGTTGFFRIAADEVPASAFSVAALGSTNGPTIRFGSVADDDRFAEIGATSGVLNIESTGRDIVLRSGTVNPIMRLEHDTGDVGIGITNPTEKLHITGNLFLQNDSDKLYLGQGKDVSINYNGSQTQFTNEVGSGNWVFPTGWMGIGINKPATDLHIETDSPILRLSANANGGHAFIQMFGGTNAVGGVSGFQLRNEQTNIDWDFIEDVGDSDKFKIIKDEGEPTEIEVITFQTDGKVGINTSSPDDLLHLSGSGDTNIRIEDLRTSMVDGSSYGGIEWESQDDTVGANGIRALIRVLGDGVFGGSQIEFKTAPDQDTPKSRMIITKEGYVGIGDTDPQQRLKVVGNINQTTGNATINKVYGEMHYHNDSSTGFPVVIDTQNVWVNVTGFNSASNELLNYTRGIEFDFVNNAIKCQISGRYKSWYKISTGNAGNNQEYQFQLAVNGVRQHITDAHRKIGASGDVGDASGGGSFICDAGNRVNLQAVNKDGTADLNVHVSTVILEYIGED